MIKNYKELCRVLDQPILSGGDSKKAQLKEFERYFNYKKVGQKFIITEIYGDPLPKADGRNKGNNSVYVKYIETILLRYLSKQQHYTCELTKLQIWLLLGMVNNKYSNIQRRQLMTLDSRMTSFQINNFYYRCNSKLTSILTSALKNLQRRCLISYYEQLVIVDMDYNSFVANDRQIKLVDAVKRDVLTQMGYEDIVQVYCSYKNDEFYNKVNLKLLELYGWKYIFKQYKLIYTKENIIKVMGQQEFELAKLSLNQKIVNAIDIQAINNVKKQAQKYKEELKKEGLEGLENELYPEDFGVYMYPEHYVEIQKKLSKELLQIGSNKDINIDDLMVQGLLTEEENDLFAC